MILPEIGEMCQIVRYTGPGECVTLWTGVPRGIQLQWRKFGYIEQLLASVWDGKENFEWLMQPEIVVIPVKEPK